jgi:phosphoglycolate phosphatase-like HAD superfamily hydrolase
VRTREIGLDITGRLQTGVGRASGFTSLPGVRQQLASALGMVVHPGTLNLAVGPAAIADWRALAAQPGIRITPETASDCGARCYPVLAAATAAGEAGVTAAIIVPEVPGYALDKVEVVAAMALREALSVVDGDEVTLCAVPVENRRAVLFDVDGTLVSSIDAYRQAAALALKPFGWSVPEDAVSRSLNFGENFWNLVIPATARGDRALAGRLRRDTMAHWPAVLASSVLLCPGVETILLELRAAGIRLGICTASQGESFLPLERAGLLDVFDEIVTARDVVNRKPDPEGLLVCLERMGVMPDEAIYIGDTVTDIRASRAAGLYSIGVLTGAGNSALLSAAGAHRILPDLRQLPGLLPEMGAS